MSITDELREWARGFNGPWKANEQAINEIADRIDECVKNIRFNEHHKGYQDGIMDGCSHYDPERTECMVSEEHGYIKLPEDEDGVPIRVGDRLDGYSCTISVKELRLRDAWRVVDKFGNEWHDHQAFQHHHAPTVEDVLRYMNGELYEAARARWASECTIGEYNERVKAILTEYAEKLREVVEHERD